MKIRLLLTINNLDTAGMKYVLAAIAFGLDTHLFHVTINVNKKTGTQLEKSLGSKFEITELPLRYPGMINLIPNLFKNSKSLRNRYDIVHDFDYSSDWYEAISTKFSGIKYVVEKTNLSIISPRWKLKLGLADKIICLSKAQANLLQGYKNKISIIPTGININQFENANPRSKEIFGIKPGDIIFICVANLVKVKGHEELIDALATVKDEFPNLKILTVGKGEEEFEHVLKQKVASKNLNGRFIFAGADADVASLLKMADLKILSTQNRPGESFGAVLPEAMAAGLPVLATRSGGPQDIVVEHETGWLIEGDGVVSLVNGIRLAMQNRDKWKTMGQSGKQRAKELYDEQQMVLSYARVYTELMK